MRSAPSLVLAILLAVTGCSDLLPVSDTDSSKGNQNPAFDWSLSGDDEPREHHHVNDCFVCHDLHDDSNNLAFVRGVISTPNSGDATVVFAAREGANSFADGDATYDGVCEVCHTNTAYHRNGPEGDHTHFVGLNCTAACHPHHVEFAPQAGRSHITHIESGGRGPALDCSDCHLPDFSALVDGEPLATTGICDACHSPAGAYDGVDDPTIGARPNWANGVYENGALAAGKESWCAGCHDLGGSVIHGASAPPVAGDNSSWGYFASGHGGSGAVVCSECHDTGALHTDAVAHTYAASADNYQAAFRLKSVNSGPPIVVPREGFDWDDPYSDPPYWELCLSCHNRYALLGGPTAPAGPYFSAQFQSNFRSDASVIIPDGLSTDIAGYSVSGATNVNSHYTHLVAPPTPYDSDRDGALDSYGTCVACHNVHGSSSPVMIRDGKLIGMEPGLNFGHVRYDRHNTSQGGCSDPIIMTSEGEILPPESQGGVMRAGGGPAANGICNFCHCSGAGTGDPEYVINCYDPDCVDYYREYLTPPVPSRSR